MQQPANFLIVYRLTHYNIMTQHQLVVSCKQNNYVWQLYMVSTWRKRRPIYCWYSGFCL